MDVFTIYYDPEDFPGSYVVRRYDIHRGGRLTKTPPFVSDTLEGARSIIPKDKINMGRDSSDPPHIVESWL